VTPTGLETDTLVNWPDRGSTVAPHVTPSNHASEWLLGVSRFVPDTWVFFADDQPAWPETTRWALGFGPTDGTVPRWSLFHCVAEDSFDTQAICPERTPSNLDLHRWSASVVGSPTTSSLLASVGSCVALYRQYFGERPDLWVRVAR
jgi:hypothetical protein